MTQAQVAGASAAVTLNRHTLDFELVDAATDLAQIDFTPPDHVHARNMILRIRNPNPIFLDILTGAAKGFALLVRKGVLDDLHNITTDAPWSVSVTSAPKLPYDILRITHAAQGMRLRGHEEASINLRNIKPKGDQATHRTNVVLEYHYNTARGQMKGERIKSLLVAVTARPDAGAASGPVTSGPGLPVAEPWDIALTSGHAVVNDGNHYTRLKLDITNVLGRDIQMSTSPYKSQIHIEFQIQPHGSNVPNALCAKGDVGTVQIFNDTGSASPNWTFNTGTEVRPGIWSLVLEAHQQNNVASGRQLKFLIDGIRTSLASGMTPLSVKLTGFTDGATSLVDSSRTIQLEKTPLLFGRQLTRLVPDTTVINVRKPDLGLSSLELMDGPSGVSLQLENGVLGLKNSAQTSQPPFVGLNPSGPSTFSLGIQTKHVQADDFITATKKIESSDALIGKKVTVTARLATPYLAIGKNRSESSGLHGFAAGWIARDGHGMAKRTGPEWLPKRIGQGDYIIAFKEVSNNFFVVLSAFGNNDDSSENAHGLGYDVDNHGSAQLINTNVPDKWKIHGTNVRQTIIRVRTFTNQSSEDTSFCFFAIWHGPQ